VESPGRNSIDYFDFIVSDFPYLISAYLGDYEPNKKSISADV